PRATVELDWEHPLPVDMAGDLGVNCGHSSPAHWGLRDPPRSGARCGRNLWRIDARLVYIAGGPVGCWTVARICSRKLRRRTHSGVSLRSAFRIGRPRRPLHREVCMVARRFALVLFVLLSANALTQGAGAPAHRYKGPLGLAFDYAGRFAYVALSRA